MSYKGLKILYLCGVASWLFICCEMKIYEEYFFEKCGLTRVIPNGDAVKLWFLNPATHLRKSQCTYTLTVPNRISSYRLDYNVSRLHAPIAKYFAHGWLAISMVKMYTLDNWKEELKWTRNHAATYERGENRRSIQFTYRSGSSYTSGTSGYVELYFMVTSNKVVMTMRIIALICLAVTIILILVCTPIICIYCAYKRKREPELTILSESNTSGLFKQPQVTVISSSNPSGSFKRLSQRSKKISSKTSQLSGKSIPTTQREKPNTSTP